MPKIWFTSDTHFGHGNVIKYSNRPFKTVEEMDEAMIQNWNSVVAQEDTVYHLGDFTFYRDAKKVESIGQRLQGYKILIKGNHDNIPLLRLVFSQIWPIHEIQVPDADSIREKQSIVLLHYSMRVWNKSHYGAWMLYGHSHGSLPDDPNSLSFDCGVDSHNFTPISYEQVKETMKKKTFKPIDHHGKN